MENEFNFDKSSVYFENLMGQDILLPQFEVLYYKLWELSYLKQVQLTIKPAAL